MKKFLILMLAVCMVLFVACGGNEQTESGDDSVDSVASEESSVAVSEESSTSSEESGVLSEESSVVESSEMSEDSSAEEGSEISEESEIASDDPSSVEVTDAFCGGRFDGKDSIKLVALGDSIARGYGLGNPATEAYPALLAKSIETALGGVKVECTNLAVDGMKTDGLISLLQNDASALADADIVVLCIGANNILGPFISAVGANSLPNNAMNDSAALGAFMDELNALLKSESFAADMQAGIAKAAEEMPQVLKLIKNSAPDALVMAMTVYSPYHGIVMSIPYLGKSVNMGEASDYWVSLLNEEIRKAVNAENCVLVETYDVFAKTAGLVNARFSLMPPKYDFDPHPNAAGHVKLAELYMTVLSEME